MPMDNSASIMPQGPGERDDGAAAVFGITGGKVELVGLCFPAGKFTPARAATWLSGRGFKPLLFVPNSGGNRRR